MLLQERATMRAPGTRRLCACWGAGEESALSCGWLLKPWPASNGMIYERKLTAVLIRHARHSRLQTRTYAADRQR
jgi:hypothetical protein